MLRLHTTPELYIHPPQSNIHKYLGIQMSMNASHNERECFISPKPLHLASKALLHANQELTRANAASWSILLLLTFSGHADVLLIVPLSFPETPSL